MKLSSIALAALSIVLLSGCGDTVDDIINGTIIPADTSSAVYTATNNASGGFDINFALNNTGTTFYNYQIGSGLETVTENISDTTTYTYTSVVGSEYTTIATTGAVELSCTPTNEESFVCTDNQFYTDGYTLTLSPRDAANGLDTLYIYKCATTYDVDIVGTNYSSTRTCEVQPTTITVNGIN
jgi:hypothetical protein